jgi:tetratricopeptide (TPR) repeat protein
MAASAVGASFGHVEQSEIFIGSVNVGATASEVIAAYQRGVDKSAAEIRELSGRIGIAESAIAGFFETMHEAQVPLEQIPAKFQELALRYQHLLEGVRTLQSDDSRVQGLKADAAAAIEAGPSSYDSAEELLKRAEAMDREATESLAAALEKRNLNAAATRAQRGELSLLRLDYESAIGHFKEAAEITPPSRPEVRVRYRWAHANALYEYGKDRGINRALEKAIDQLRSLARGLARDRFPLDWAMTQNNLGNALLALGERQSGAARLEEAITAYRDALLEFTRDRVPLQWATAQNNLGIALKVLGERESGTARLEEAVTASRDALLEWTRDRVPLQWATAQNNLGNALKVLGERESGTARLEEAITAYRDALLEFTRDRVPLDWAMTQNNLGNALLALGKRESGAARLEEAVKAYRDALLERTRDRVPLDWATTQNNLEMALERLGQRGKSQAAL